MWEARRALSRLIFLLLSVALGVGVCAAATPTMTTISDTVYRADECLNASVWAKAGQP